MEFPHQTPVRGSVNGNNLLSNDFCSAQKFKYDNSKHNSSAVINNHSSLYPSVSSEVPQKEVYDNQIPVKVRSHDR